MPQTPGRHFALTLLALFVGLAEVRSAHGQTSNIPPFRIASVQLQNGVIILGFNSATGTVYTLQGSDLSRAYWDEILSQPGNGGSTNFTIPMVTADKSCFYRIAAVPRGPLNLFPAGPLLASGTVSLADAVVRQSYQLDISPITTGTGPYLIAFSGTLPTGISGAVLGNNTSNALFRLSSSGTNLVEGQRVQFTISAHDSAGTALSRTYDLRVIAGAPQIFTTDVTLKTAAPTNVFLAGSGGTAPVRWSLVSGTLPAGVQFSTNGIFSGTPTAEASEKNEDGLYTNLVQLSDSFTDRVSGFARPRAAFQTITTLVRFSFELNIVADRPDGPVLGGVCAGCHGPYFPPDFTSGTALSVINVSAGSGNQCDSSWVYVTPGIVGGSLLYWKVTFPPCGNQMPYGGPYFNDIQINRLARWINELTGNDTD